MLTWLELEQDTAGIQLRARWPDWTFLNPPPGSPELLQQREAAATAYIRHQCPEQPGLLADMKTMLPYVAEEDWAFALACLIAHERSPNRGARNTPIKTAVDNELTILGGLAAPHRSALEAWRVLARLFPSQYLSQGLRTPLTTLRWSLWESHPNDPAFQPITAKLLGIERALLSRKLPNANAVLDEIRRMVLTRPASVIMDTLKQLDVVIKNQQIGIVQAVCEQRARLPAGLPPINLRDLVAQGVKEMALGNPAPVPEVARFVTDWLIELESVNADETLRQAIEAIDGGVEFGEPRTSHSRAALAKMRTDHADRMSALQAEWMQRPKGIWLAVPTRPQDRPDMDPVSSWSVDRLLAWIEGPLPQPSGSGPALDRQRVARAARRKELAPANVQKTAPAPHTEPVPDDQAPPEEVDRLIANGMAATAAFFLDNCRDLIASAKRLQIKPALIQPCQRLVDPLSALANTPEEWDEAKARDLLARAEMALQALHRDVRQTQIGNKRLARFNTALMTALASNDLVLGKRHGGEIGFPMRADEWGMVVEAFHHRCLSMSHTLWLNNNQRMPLGADQALALYVTASSQSNHLFDISVHLWRRRAGRSSPAAQRTEPFAPMNTNDWFDTYIPCLVLHVNPAG